MKSPSFRRGIHCYRVACSPVGETLTLFEVTQVFYVDFQCEHRGKKLFFSFIPTHGTV